MRGGVLGLALGGVGLLGGCLVVPGPATTAEIDAALDEPIDAGPNEEADAPRASPPDLLYLTFEDGVGGPFASAAGEAMIEPSPMAAVVDGRFGQGLHIDTGSAADGSYATVVDDAAYTTPPYTLEMWVLRKSATCGTLFSDRDPALEPSRELDLRISSVGSIVATTHDGDAVREVLWEVGVPLGQWHHVAVVRDAGNFAVAYDGVIGESIEIEATAPVSGPFLIGRQADHACKSDAVVDEIKLSSWAKTGPDLAASMADGVGDLLP